MLQSRGKVKGPLVTRQVVPGSSDRGFPAALVQLRRLPQLSLLSRQDGWVSGPVVTKHVVPGSLDSFVSILGQSQKLAQLSIYFPVKVGQDTMTSVHVFMDSHLRLEF